MQSLRWYGAVVVLFALSGCSNNSPEPAKPTAQTEPAPPPAVEPTPEPEPVAEEPQLSEQAKRIQKALQRREPIERTKPPQVLTATEPEELVKQLAQAIADKNYQALWEMLPESYQKELDTTVKDVANKIDPQLWRSVTNCFQMTIFALKEQKERFFNHPIAEMLPFDKEAIREAWDPAIAVGDALINSELYDIEEFRTMDVPTFLHDTAGIVMTNLEPIAYLLPAGPLTEIGEVVQSLGDAEAEKVSGDDETAVVKITIPDRDPMDVEFVKVDGKWIPKVVQNEWPNWIEQLKAGLAFIPTTDTEEGKKQSKSLANNLGFVHIGLAALAGSDSDEGFDDKVRAAWKVATGEDFPIPRPGDEKADEQAKEAGDSEPAPADESAAKPEEPSEAPAENP